MLLVGFDAGFNVFRENLKILKTDFRTFEIIVLGFEVKNYLKSFSTQNLQTAFSLYS